MGIWLLLVMVVGLLIFYFWVNSRDRKEINGLIRGDGLEEEALEAKLEQARQIYQQALSARDKDLALKLGKAYYACKTDYEYLITPTIPFPSGGKLDAAKKQEIEQEIERDNTSLRRKLQTRNEHLLHKDLSGIAA